MTIQDYALRQTGDLLRRVVFQVNRVCRLKNEESVHDLRVSIRRLQQCLRVFRQFFPASKAKELRKTLGHFLDLAAEVRNRDIALEFLRSARGVKAEELERQWVAERREAEQQLIQELKQWAKKNPQRKWRTRLGL